MQKTPYISIIIPAYNSHKYIVYIIKRVIEVLENKKLGYEVICVSDGSSDDTQEIAEKEALKYSGKVKVYGYKKNMGKGYAVRYGMSRSIGKVVGFIDADREIAPESIVNLLNIMESKKADVVVGSKRNRKSKVVYPMIRKMISLFYYCLVKVLFNVKVSDTQAGVKLFQRRVIVKILPKLTIDGFAFDIDMLTWSQRLGFSKLYDGPIIVELKQVSDASILKSFRIITESYRMFSDTVQLFFKIKFLK